MGGEFMYTALATITDVIVDGCNIWIQICYDNRVFPAHHELNAGRLIDYERIAFLLKITKSKKIDIAVLECGIGGLLDFRRSRQGVKNRSICHFDAFYGGFSCMPSTKMELKRAGVRRRHSFKFGG